MKNEVKKIQDLEFVMVHTSELKVGDIVVFDTPTRSESLYKIVAILQNGHFGVEEVDVYEK